MRQRKTARNRVKDFCKSRSLTYGGLSREIGDPGGQLGQWLSEGRDRFPFRLKVKLSAYSGIPLSAFTDREELATAKMVCAVMARDAAS